MNEERHTFCSFGGCSIGLMGGLTREEALAKVRADAEQAIESARKTLAALDRDEVTVWWPPVSADGQEESDGSR